MHPYPSPLGPKVAPEAQMPRMMKNTEISSLFKLQNREFEVWSPGVRAHGLPSPGTTPPT